VRTSQPLLRGKKSKASINSRKSENYALKVRSLKLSIITEVPTTTAFVVAFDAKALNCTELLESYLAGGNRLLTATGKPTEIATIEIFDTTHGLRFLQESHLCFLICAKKNKHTAPTVYGMSGGIKTLRHNVRTTLQFAYHGCKNLTHTSKTPHVKRTQMVVTVRFTIRVTSLHRWNKQEIKICDWFLAYYTCGVKLLEYRVQQSFRDLDIHFHFL